MAFCLFTHHVLYKVKGKLLNPRSSFFIRIIGLIFGSVLFVSNELSAQVVGDYASAGAGPANWATAGSWVVCVANGTWAGATVAVAVPGAGTNVWIRTGHNIRMNGNSGACKNLTINGTINWNNTCSGFTTNVSGNLVISGGTISGSRTGNLIVAGTFTVPAGVAASVQRVNLTITGATTINGTLNFATSANGIKSFYGLVTVNSGGSWNSNVSTSLSFRGGITNNGTFGGTANATYNFNTNNQALNGTSPISFRRDVSITGNITVTNNNTVTIIRNLTGSVGGSTWVNAANSTLNAGGSLLSTGTLTATANPNTINYNMSGNQTVKPTTYYNLTLSGTNTKTITTATTTVNNILSVGFTSATATISAPPTYGATATLQYNTATSRNAGSEWITPFTPSGGVIIANTGTITLNASKVFNANVPLTINSGATLNTSAANNYGLTFGGNFVNGGTLTANASNITIANTAVSQSIAGFTTTGLVSLTKSTGTATFTGSVNGAGLTINGAGGGILNLGTGLTHTFTGVVTLTAGTLNGGSSILKVNATSATAWNGNGSVFNAGTGTANFGGAAQTLSASATTFNNLTFSGSALKTLTTANCTVNGILSMEGTATASAVPTYGASSTLQYKGSALQTTGPEFPALFGGSGGVIINNASGVNLGASSGVANALTLTSGTFGIGAYTLTLNGPTIAGTPNNLSTTSSSSLSFGGSSTPVQIPGSVLALNNLTIANSNGINLMSSPVISGTLALNSGILTTGGNTIQANIATRITGHVNGSLKLPVTTGAGITKNFYIGDATNYTPVSIVFASVSGAGFLTVNTSAGQHPNISTSGINYSLDVNRYYTLINSGTAFTTFSPTFNFMAGDIIGGANPANFIIKRYSSGWFNTTIGTRNPTNTTATGVTAFGDFAIGIVQALDHFTLVLADPQTNGISFTGINTLTARDISNNVMTLFDASGDNVTISANAPLTTGAGAISGLSGSNKLINASDFVSGVANLTALGLRYTGAVGTSTFTATSASGKTGTSGSITIDVGELSISAIGTQTAGIGFGVTVTALDANGNPVNVTSNSLITLTLSSGTGTLGGTLIGTILSGTNSITISGVTYDKAESGVSITATQTSGTPSLTAGISNTFTVNAGAATHLVISSISTQTAGAGFSVTVVSEDAFGNPTNVTSATGISLTKATGTGSLGGTSTGTIANGTNSITIIGVTYNVAESGVSITASRTSGMALASGTSNTFTVIPDAAASTLTPTTGSITANGTSTQVLTVQARDANGINLTTGGSTVTITRLSGTGTIGPVTDNGNGTYTATVTSPTLAGSGIFVSTLNGNPIKSGSGSQTQATISYVPGAANAAQSMLTPTSGSIADDGVTAQVLTVQAIDANGNLLTTGGATVTITKFSGQGNITAVTDHGNGTYTASVTSGIAGSGVFVATLGGNPIMNGTASQTTSTITYTLGTANAAASTLTPVTSNLMADGSSTQDLTVQAKDATGNDLATGGETVTITRLSGTGTIGGVTDNGDGTYTATVTAAGSPGSGVFIATLNGAQVKSGTGSQTTATVTYGSSAAQSTLTPTAESITADGISTIELTVDARDVSGYDVTTGGEIVVITKSSGTGTISAVTDNGDGSYTATVTSPVAAGSGTFVATLNGSPVKSGTGSQTQAIITYAGPANATQSTLTPTSASIIANGSSTVVLTVQAKDAGGNNLSTGGSAVTITKFSGTGTISSVTDNLDGTYTAVVTSPVSTGTGVFIATLGGNPVKSGTGSQTQATVNYIPSTASAAQSTLSPTTATIASCGNTQVLTVQAKDAFGNNLSIGGAAVTITKQSGTGTIGLVTDNGDGTYTATVTSPSPTTSGNGIFVATLNGSPVMSGTGSQTTATITYTENLSAIISGGASPICYNTNPGTLTATGSGSNGSFTYLWYANGISTGSSTNTYDPGNLTSSSTFYCAVSSGTCGTVNTSTTSITVIPLPGQPAAFTASASPVCAGTTGVTYTVPNVASMTYNWSYSGTGVTINGSTNSVTLDFNNSATGGTLSVTATNSCGTSSARTMDITVNSRPVPNLAGNQTVCTGAVETYSTGPGMSLYVWNVTGGTISGGGTGTDPTATITWNTLGSQTVSINYTDPNGCTAATATQLSVNVYRIPETGPSYYVPNNFNP
jgi:hypothetical protein